MKLHGPMPRTFTASSTIAINVPRSRVWEALTTPKRVKQYFFGADVVSDWKVGSPMIYRGEWQGKPYEDKAHVLELDPERRLVTTQWSPLSGVPDAPENYHVISYDLRAEGLATPVTITQTKNSPEQEAAHSAQNWTMVLAGLKRLLEQTA
jgi:uncharacterized protein YndB with AHSA1/START domain